MNIDCSGLNPGVYYYRIKAGDEARTAKMMIAR
jgi:hypothetical protein